MPVEKMNLVQAINACLAQEMERDPNILLMGEDVGVDGGVFRVTDGLQAKFGPERVVDSPLAESGIAGTAIGMAAYGMRPVIEMQFDGFAYFALHQLVLHAAKMRNRTRGRITVPLVVRAPFGGGIRALELHCEPIEISFINTPGIKVVCPSNPYDAKGLLASALQEKDPVLFLEPKRLYRAFKDDVPTERFTVPIGEAKIAREGKDVTIISYGAMTRTCLNTADNIKSEIDCEVVDLRTLSPLDEKTILDSAKKTGRVVVVHEAPKSGGFGGELAALIAEKALMNLQAPIQRVTAPDVPVPLAKLEEFYIPDEFRISRAIRNAMHF
ncbi:alpha-ketoacid dehydrogenase subunit beta [Candidatus Micrarchaeota archaeon]|nr:alpha-ketoacid dehydrogenase subunit beta [Candidatus Micrarchaeota archaeon]